jgi:hypothetical protein
MRLTALEVLAKAGDSSSSPFQIGLPVLPATLRDWFRPS